MHLGICLSVEISFRDQKDVWMQLAQKGINSTYGADASVVVQ